MESTSNKIIIIFEKNNLITSEEIKSSLVLQKRFADIYVLDEIYKNSELLKKYNYLLDCSFGNKIFNQYLKNKKGILIKEKYEYIKTSTNKIILSGPNISQLTIATFSKEKELIEKYEENKNEYSNRVYFLMNKDPEYRNIMNFEHSIKEKGLDFTDFIKQKKEKEYKLVLKIPDKKEENVIYVTPENIEILYKLIKISEKIVF